METEKRMDTGGFWPGFVGALTNVLSALVFVIVILTALAGMLGQLTAKLKANEMVKGGKVPPAATGSNPPPAAQKAGVAQESGAAAVAGERPSAARQTLEIEFDDSAIMLDAAAIRQLDDNLARLGAQLSSASARLTVYTSEFTESRRKGFLRAVAVRNYLLERGMKAPNIVMAVTQGREGASPAPDGKTVQLNLLAVP